MSYFCGKTIVITGGGGTLGSCIALHLARQGAKVVVVGRKLSKLKKVQQEISNFGGTCLTKVGDVTQELDMLQIAQELRTEIGLCDCLVNAAGGNHPDAITTHSQAEKDEWRLECSEALTFFNLDLGVFRNVIETNLMGAVICCRVFGQQMMEQGGGSIVNFASMNSYRPLSCRPAYAISKAGVVNFTQWLAQYLATANIRVNAVAPGFVTNENNVCFYGSLETGYTASGNRILAHTPMHRFGKAEELLGTVEWLLNSETSGFVTGITVAVDGGFLTCSGL